MCCFSRAVKHVSATRILARRTGDGRQAIVYSMSLSFDVELAMVLPIPVVVGSGDDAVRFVDLSGYPTFFDDVLAAFPPIFALPAKQSRSFGPAVRAEKLVVHDVGDFEASYVPTREDFARLDERFRLDPRAWDSLPGYGDYGFAVFRLRPRKGLLGGAKTQTIHPMAFTFPSREPEAVFFPTVHVHDGTAPATATFDHTLVVQDDGVVGATLGWTRSNDVLGRFVDGSRSRDLLDADRTGFAQSIFGVAPNVDVWLRPPADVDLASLAGESDYVRYRIHATAAYQLGEADGARNAAWRRNARRIGAFARAFGPALEELVVAEREHLRLIPLDPGLRPHFINGMQLWTGTTYMDGRAGHDGGSGFVTFRPFSDQLEQQEVVLAFARLPDEATTNRIHGLLRGVLDRCVAA